MLGALRTRGARLIRRLGLLPGGMSDGLGEDAQLEDTVLTTGAVVFFPDPPENIYQLRQWASALDRLDAPMGVTIITQDSRTTRILRKETRLPVVCAALTRTVGALLSSGEVRIVLYVGQANANAVALRSTSVVHVFLNHGDSDKFVSVSNQVKAYDIALVAGQAGIDRHQSAVMLFDASERLRVIGRPQVVQTPPPAGPTTVLYCPTWEGTLALNAYSSVKAYGERIVASIIADPDLHLIYRPHPRTGASDRTYREADARIRDLIAASPETARVDTTPASEPSMARAHVMITDVSAVASDWLGQRRALVTTVPAHPGARIAAPGLIFASTPHLDGENAHLAAAVVKAALADDTTAATIDRLFEYYLGGLSAEAAHEAFVAVCTKAAVLCDNERARIGLGGPQ